MAREVTIVNSILSFINNLPYGVAEKVQGTARSSGKSDINACINGRCIRIEVKTADHGNKESKKQSINLRRWSAAGAICGVVYSLEELKTLLEKNNVQIED